VPSWALNLTEKGKLMQSPNIPVYLFTGFLEGGKTHIIQESMSDERFNTGEKTLIILCEEGIEELDVSTFPGKNVYLATLENESDVTPEKLIACMGGHKIDRIIIEYNGMWQLGTLYENLPEDIDVIAHQDGYATITPLHFDMTAHDYIKEIKEWGIEK